MPEPIPFRRAVAGMVGLAGFGLAVAADMDPSINPEERARRLEQGLKTQHPELAITATKSETEGIVVTAGKTSGADDLKLSSQDGKLWNVAPQNGSTSAFTLEIGTPYSSAELGVCIAGQFSSEEPGE